MGLRRAGTLALLGTALAGSALGAQSPDDAFRAATEEIRRGDYPRATAALHALAAEGRESASLYWNWAQAAAARGAQGEALWALLRAREVEPGDSTVAREIERRREAANLDPAEVAPEPLAALTRLGRRFHLDLLAAVLALLSLAAHLAARLQPTLRWPVRAAWSAGVLAVLAAVPPVGGSFARPTAVVVAAGTPLLDSASPTAQALGALREGEVVPVLAESGGYLRVEDSSGARGWAAASQVRRLDRPPPR